MTTTINADNVTGGAIVTGDSSGVLALQTAGTTAMTIDTSQKVGIGTSTIRLGEKLHVLGYGITTSSAENTDMGMFGTFGSSNLILGSFNNIPVEIRQGNSARFLIGTSGQLGIGGATYGTAGQVLTSGGSSAAPTWTTPSSGALVYLATVDASSSSTVDVENAFTAYDEYVIKITNLKSDTGGIPLLARVKIAALGGYDTNANYVSCSTYFNSTSTTPSVLGNSGGSSLYITPSVIGPNSFVNNFEFRIHKPTASSSYLDFDWNGTAGNSYRGPVSGGGTNYYSTSSQLTGVRFYLSGGTILSGTFRLYGIAKS